MRIALVHAACAGFEAGAPAVADPDAPPDAVAYEDCLLALVGVEPEDRPRPNGVERIRATASDFRCADVLLVPCPALVDAAAGRERTEAVLTALDGALADLETVRAPTDYHLELDVRTKGHPEAVRVFRPGGERPATSAFDATALADAGLAELTAAGLRWTPAGTVARRALLGGVAARFAAAGAEPVTPPLLPDRVGASETAPDALCLADPPVLLRPRATFGADPTGRVYAIGPAVEGATGVYRPEALAPSGDDSAFERWLRLAARALDGLGFDPTPELVAGDGDDAALVREALADAALTPAEPDASDARVEFHTDGDGPTGVVARETGRVRCAPVGSVRRALAALAPDLPAALAPTQLRFVPLAGSAPRCRSLADAVAARTDVDDRDRPTSERLADAENVPFVAVVGERDDDIPVAGPDGRERRVPVGDLDDRIRSAANAWDWPPVRARRPTRLGERSEQS